MNMYEVTLHRIVEHETVYRVKVSNDEEAEELVLTGDYDEIISDSEISDIERNVTDIERVWYDSTDS